MNTAPTGRTPFEKLIANAAARIIIAASKPCPPPAGLPKNSHPSMMRLLFLLLCVCALPACKSVRTVTSGPRVISEGGSDYDAQKEARSAEAGRQAAASGVVGQADQGGSNFAKRFGTYDPHGYGSEGLNAMSEQMFGGNTGSQDMKSFSGARDFLAKRYGDTGELGQKESATQRMKSWMGGKKANTEKQAPEMERGFSGGNNVLANKTSDQDGRTLKDRSSREDGRVAGTKDFYPARKVLDGGHDAPRIIAEGDKKTNDAVWRLIKSRPRDNPATVEDIRQMLGKTD